MNPTAISGLAADLYLVLVASLLGSFINLAADRLPRRESLLRPRSHCRRCGRTLDFVDLIPVAGYVIRRGRCASCGTPIGVSSPAVEAACGATMLFSVWAFGGIAGPLVGFALVVAVGACAVGLRFARKRPARAETESSSWSAPERRAR
jgi:prepilin signal peptidase PulO-like enzyme (type II secretory pathway)